MTATVARPAEAEAIRRGWDTYHRVMNAGWLEAARDAIREALDGLLGTLETWSDVLDEDTHPATAYPELEHEDDAYDKALTMTAQDAGDWAGELGRLVPEEADEGERAA